MAFISYMLALVSSALLNNYYRQNLVQYTFKGGKVRDKITLGRQKSCCEQSDCFTILYHKPELVFKILNVSPGLKYYIQKQKKLLVQNFQILANAITAINQEKERIHSVQLEFLTVTMPASLKCIKKSKTECSIHRKTGKFFKNFNFSNELLPAS